MKKWVALCAASEIAPGQREVFGVDNRWIAVFNVSEKIYAIEDLCTHDGNELAFDRADQPSKLVGYEIECPRHGGRFDIRSGKATRSPAEIAVPWYETRIHAGKIEVLT
ncbi:MAG: non-heme iron oxygenase ferredoxin subunit [Chloroflexi bacterium]|nr:non-heme iron oxygenase ferredoxin subunit [Chloroflexota bacterium]MDE2651338.1 non-heme iron oxygenase ferredoxin subunit [Chloroflexota bacterium]MXX49457.1 non-heme iron oxygenase ferredoxin subunit [Chloroflexota bacterium]MXX82940.1 non-heme iron oxygenase ferredoxin subunit [Chloroflexota bacterium]MYA94116.1 non-heme iron oxygenase ferredoxin subunit [Chloroflexota bacterium]